MRRSQPSVDPRALDIAVEFDPLEGNRSIVVSGLPAAATITLHPDQARELLVRVARALADAERSEAQLRARTDR